MGLGVTFIALSILLFGHVFGDINNDFDDNYFENGFNDDGLFIDSNDNNFDDLNDFDDNFFENRFDDNDLFDSDDSNVVRGGILGGSRAISRPTGRPGGFTRMDYIPRQRQHSLQGRIGAGVLGGRFNPISSRPMVLPRRLPKMPPIRMPKIMPKIMPRKMPMIMPRIGAGVGGIGAGVGRIGGGVRGVGGGVRGFGGGVGGIGGFPLYPNFGKYGGRGRIPSFRRRRISAGIGGMQSRGFGKYFRHKMMGSGGLSGFPRKKLIKMY